MNKTAKAKLYQQLSAMSNKALNAEIHRYNEYISGQKEMIRHFEEMLTHAIQQRITRFPEAMISEVMFTMLFDKLQNQHIINLLTCIKNTKTDCARDKTELRIARRIASERFFAKHNPQLIKQIIGE
jgi:hypothetical protein